MKNSSSFFPFFLCFFLVFSACTKDQKVADVTSPPQLPSQAFTYNNTDNFPQGVFDSEIHNLNNEVATLGRVLFYDPKLSATNRISCASCHLQAAGFSDTDQFSLGFTNQATPRNAMPIANLAFNRGFFWDLRVSTLEDLVSQPIENHIEMGMETIDVLTEKLATVDFYPALFEKAYGSDEITSEGISRAVSDFMKSITSFDSKYDQGLENNFSSFSPLENLGKTVFFEKANCSGCHVAPLFSPSWANASANIGLDMVYEDPGVSSTLTQVVTADGQVLFVENPLGNINSGEFKIPSLRNIALTAPYMHDGRFNTLEEVVEHYNSGIKNHPQLSWHFRDFDQDTQTAHPRRLNLTDLEKEALVAFLKTLSGESFRTDEKFSDPFLR